MHRCLQIPEILDIICSYTAVFQPDDYWPDLPARSASLQALSLTCRAFYEPSCNYIWSSLITIRPLIQCMSPDVWKMDRIIVVDGEDSPLDVPILELCRIIRPDDMVKFNHKAQRVRTYGSPYFPSGGRRYASSQYELPMLWRALNAANGGRCLFPNLKHIIFTCEDISTDWLSYVHLFLSTTLKFVSVEEASIDEDLSLFNRCVFFSALEAYCPFLEELVIQDTMKIAEDRSSSLEAKTLSNLVFSLHHLTILSLNHVSAELVEKLSSLPNLRELDLDIFLEDLGTPRGEPYRLSPPTQNDSYLGFPSLENLNLRTRGAQFGIDFFDLLVHENSPLRSFEYEFHFYEPLNSWDRLLELLVAKASPSCLRHVKIVDYSGHGNSMIRGEKLELLFPFSHLEYLELCSPCGVGIDRSFIGSSARSWRDIKGLLLYNSWEISPMHIPRIKLIDLAIYAVECPHLVELAIGFDARDAEPLQPDARKNGSVRTLYVVNSSLDSPPKTAALLRDIFPEIQQPSSMFPPGTKTHQLSNVESPVQFLGYRSLWMEVFNYLPRR